MARGGRGGRRGRGHGPSKSPSRKSHVVEKDDDMMYDEVDRHHNRKQALSMNVEDDEAADSEDDSALLDDEAAVFDVAAEDESTSEEEDDEEALEEEIERGGRTGQMARTARELGMRLKKHEAEFAAEDDDQDEDEEGGAAGGKALWGASKRAYHGADAADASDDEEAAREEEAEAVRLQREAAAGLRPEDYADGLDLDLDEDEGVSEADDEDEDEPRTMGGAADRGEAGIEVEEVEKDLDSLDEQAQREAVAADAPELGALLAELRANLAEVRTRVGPLVKEVRAGQLATAEGVSYLEAKNLLLLSYCTHIVFYLLLKAEGRPVRTHPVIGRLLQIRTYLEKLRPIDKKLQYQMDKLLRAAAQLHQPADASRAGTGSAVGPASADPQSYGPNPDQLLPKVPLPSSGSFGGAAAGADGGEDGLANGNGLYRPPRNVAVSMEDDPDRRRSAKERRQERDHGKRAKRSALLRELAQEVEGAPEEVGAAGAAAGMDSAQARRQLRQLEARAAAEEDLMMRVPLSKEQRKAVRAQRRAGFSGQALLDDFGDDVADLVDMANGGGRQSGNGGIDDGFMQHAVSQRYGGDLSAAGLKGRSGDDDLPLREPLHERRAKYDAVRARQTAADDDDADGNVLPGGAKRVREREIDDTYAAVAEAAAAKKKARKAAHTAPALAPPLPEEEADGARGINQMNDTQSTDAPVNDAQAIEKNRGLTPHRSKALKNPRKKHRIKFAEANVRRAGQVQPMREKSAGYGGEATGIKARVSKSRRF